MMSRSRDDTIGELDYVPLGPPLPLLNYSLLEISGSPDYAAPNPPIFDKLPTPENCLLEGISNLFNNPDYADVKIYIGQVELPAHGVILAAQSAYFDKALKGPFVEATTKEFRFNEGNPHAYWRVFEHMYKGRYSEDSCQAIDAQDDNDLLKHVRVYMLADYFQLKGLKTLALKRLQEKLKALWASEGFVASVKEIYTMTTKEQCGIRSAVVAVSRAYLAQLWRDDAFRDLISEGGDFAVDLVAKFAT